LHFSPKGRGGEGPSALLALLDDAQRHRLRRGPSIRPLGARAKV